MLAKIKQLEQKSKILELDDEQRGLLIKNIEVYIRTFLEDLPTSSTYQPDLINKNIYSALSVRESPASTEDIIELIKNFVVNPGINITAPGFMGYIPGGGLYPSALGDYIADITNRFAGMFSVSPGAARLDNLLISWMCRLVGYTKKAGGNLSSGGSLANFIAIVTAREMFGFKSREFNRIVIYTTSQVHHSMLKGLRIAGLKEAVVRFVPVDKGYRLKPEVLNQMIVQDIRRKLIPWLIVATFGTTNTGSIDPLEEIVAIAKQFKLWLHIDAAYGGFFLLCPKIKEKFKIIHQADSITIDPHKGLFIPYGLGVILTRQENSLLKTYNYQGIDYIPDLQSKYYEVSPASLSPELSVHFRGLRMWLPLKLFGLKPFRSALEEKLLLAHYFYQELLTFDKIEIACEPALSIVAFRYCPETGDANVLNKELAETIKKHGRIFLSTTYLNHQLYLRMACLNYRTHIDTIQEALSELKKCIQSLKQS